MAGEAVVGALRVVLGMDTASFEDGAKKASKQLGDFGTQMKAVFAGTGLERIVERVFDAIKDKLVDGVKHALEFADQMGKTAQKVGVSVETLTGLRVAAELSDVSMESLSTAMGKLSKSIVDATNQGGLARDTFKSLGISVADLRNKSPADVLALMADRFSTAEDGAKKTAAALNLMGRGGKDLIPLLNEGSQSLRDFADMAERMGLIVSRDTAAQAQKFNDNLKILKLSFEGMTNQVVAQLLPGLVRLSDEFVTTAKSGEQAKNTATAIADAFKNIVVAGYQFIALAGFLKDSFKGISDTQQGIKDGSQAIEQANSPLAQLWEIIKAIDQATSVPLMGDPQKQFVDPGTKAAELGKILEDVRQKIEAMFSAPLKVEVHKPLTELGDVGNKVQKELDKLSLQTLVLKGSFDALAPGLPAIAASLGLTAENGKNLATTAAGLTGQLATLNTAMQAFRAAQITQENLLPWQLYEKQMTSLNATFATGQLSVETYGRASLKIATDLQTSWGQTAQAIVSPMAQAFKDLSSINKQYAGAAKAAAIAEATVNTYLAATKALATIPPPFNYAAAAAVVAAGLVHVAKIQATQFATGGSFKVGGVGGIDSQLVSLALTPGEMVNIRKPGEDRGSSASEITINMRGRDLISRDMMRDLVDALNDAARDGYRLKLAEA